MFSWESLRRSDKIPDLSLTDVFPSIFSKGWIITKVSPHFPNWTLSVVPDSGWSVRCCPTLSATDARCSSSSWLILCISDQDIWHAFTVSILALKEMTSYLLLLICFRPLCKHITSPKYYLKKKQYFTPIHPYVERSKFYTKQIKNTF